MIFFASFIYAIVVYFTVANWSFDFGSVVDTTAYFQATSLGWFEIVQYNGIVIYYLSKIWPYSAYNLVESFYAAASFFRSYVIFRICGLKLGLLPLLSMFVIIDLNTSRYSTGFTLVLLILHMMKCYPRYWRLAAIPVVFVFHNLSAALLLLCEFYTSIKLFALLFIVSILSIYNFPEYLPRFFAPSDDPVPGISILYLVLSLILASGMKSVKLFYPFLFLVALLVALNMVGLVVNSSYLTRFSLLYFDFLTIVYVLSVSRFKQNAIDSGSKFTINLIFIFSFVYQLALIGGNVWRFFT